MRAKAVFYLVATNLLGGASYLATKYALVGFEGREILVVLARTFLGSLLFLPWVVVAFRTLRLSRGEWLRLAAVGVFGYAAPLILGTIGQSLSSATNGSLMIGVEPVSILMLSALFLREPLTRVKVLAIACGLAGALLIVFEGIVLRGEKLTPHFAGDVLLFVHALCWSLYSVIGKPLLGRIDPMSFSALTTLIALGPIAAASVPFFPGAAVFPLAGASIAGILFLAIGVTFLAVLFWNLGLELVPASKLATFIFLQPLTGVFLGAVVEGEPFSLGRGLAGILILLGVFLATRDSPKSPK